LPSGSESEHAAGAAIVDGLTNVRLLDRQPLDMVAREIADAAIAVGVDTGLLHVAAALRVPLVAIFVGASNPRLTGPVGEGPIEILGTDGPPTTENVAAAIEAVLKRAG
ncbi:MAG TPA: glycosyltransferase family 9 protein, partial [Hyphomicrobiaceae bacterium]|nr:glycosyltransferase family 9 protein [Hyphomicrobiaceae bacterium]